MNNPSSCSARFPILVLAAAGLGVASYLAAYQFGSLRSVWEPFFGDGSVRVLHSFLSRLLPLPDAALGACGYAAELVAGAIGGAHRWRTLPWLVIIYGGIVAALALTAIALTLIQVFVVRAGCTLCLSSAMISFVIAWLAREEIFAAFRQLRTTHADL